MIDNEESNNEIINNEESNNEVIDNEEYYNDTNSIIHNNINETIMQKLKII